MRLPMFLAAFLTAAGPTAHASTDGTATAALTPADHTQDIDKIEVSVQQLFVPIGFDDNDDIEVIVDGVLPDSCHRLSSTEIRKDSEKNIFTVIQWARRIEGNCLSFPSPYTTVAHIGRLEAGVYKISARGLDHRLLLIGTAPGEGLDDFLYANLSSIDVEQEPDTPRRYAILSGYMNNTCFAWKEVRMLNQGAVVVLLPILESRSEDDCRPSQQPFRQIVDLPSGLQPGRYLLYVRNMNGRSLHMIFNVTPVR